MIPLDKEIIVIQFKAAWGRRADPEGVAYVPHRTNMSYVYVNVASFPGFPPFFDWRVAIGS